jgi:hypothetical protein
MPLRLGLYFFVEERFNEKSRFEESDIGLRIVEPG